MSRSINDRYELNKTIRQFGTYLKEQLKAVFLEKESSALSEHACQTNHTTDLKLPYYYHQSAVPSEALSGNMAYQLRLHPTE